MALPVEHEALQQVGPAQERRVRRRRAADHDMVAAAGAGMAAVDHELVGAEAATGGVLVEADGDVDRLAPARAGWTLTSMTPGSGVTLMTSRRGSYGGA